MKFYEDPVYIEMCRKAEEIQEDRVLMSGDYYELFAKRGKVKICNRGITRGYRDLISQNSDWLPRLDQLIEMLDIPLQKLLTDIYHWDCGGLGAGWPTGMDHSWEVMFLGYLMETKFEKKWSFEKREWVSLP